MFTQSERGHFSFGEKNTRFWGEAVAVDVAGAASTVCSMARIVLVSSDTVSASACGSPAADDDRTAEPIHENKSSNALRLRCQAKEQCFGRQS
jgi:hypothetical protein